MRVLTVGNLYPPHHHGGYERAWAAVVEALEARGDRVTVLCAEHREPGVDELDEGDVRRTLGWYARGDRFSRPGPLGVARVERHDARELQAALDGADLVMWWSMGGLPLSLITRAARAGVPSLAVVHDGWPTYGRVVDPFTRRHGLLSRNRYDPARVGWWSFNSAYSRDLLARAGIAVPPERTSIEHPGVDPSRFAPAAAAPAWEGRLLVLGRVEPRKGVETAVRALTGLPGCTLEVAGPQVPGHVQELERIIDGDPALAGRVSFSGPTADPAAAIARADAVLFPVTWEEPFGLVPLEAMAVGRPVIATGTGGSAEFLRDGENALLSPPGEYRALAAAVSRLAGDTGLRERLIAGGAATAARFTEQAFADAILARADAVAR